jgi:transcription elongation factor GreA-like protein
MLSDPIRDSSEDKVRAAISTLEQCRHVDDVDEILTCVCVLENAGEDAHMAKRIVDDFVKSVKDAFDGHDGLDSYARISNARHLRRPVSRDISACLRLA